MDSSSPTVAPGSLGTTHHRQLSLFLVPVSTLMTSLHYMFACDLAPLVKACGARQRGCVCQDPFPLPGRVAESGSTHLVCADGMNEWSRKKEELLVCFLNACICVSCGRNTLVVFRRCYKGIVLELVHGLIELPFYTRTLHTAHWD